MDDMKKLFLLIIVISVSMSVFAFGNSEASGSSMADRSILVYVTGITAGSASYELMVAGAEDFVAEHPEVSLKVYEAGYNQAEWQTQLTDLVATGLYSVVVCSNPAMTDICSIVSDRFPKQEFIITDAYLDGVPRIKTYLFNQYEQSLFLGYLAGLVTTSDMPDANPAKRIGFIAAQEYPLLNNHMVPGFLDGARMVDPEIDIDFRVIGNWYDAAKCGELASSMISGGVDVFAVIAGGADTGLITVAKSKGAYIVYHNINNYAAAPGIIIGCGDMGQRKLVYDALCRWADGTIGFGEAEIVGISDGYMDFIDTDPLFTGGLPEDIRTRFESFMADLRAGKIEYEIPPLN